MNFDQKVFHKVVYWISFIGLIGIISDFGYKQTITSKILLDIFYFLVLTLGIISTTFRYVKKEKFYKSKVFIFDLLSILFTLWVFYNFFISGESFKEHLTIHHLIGLKIAVALTFIREASELKINYKRKIIPPALLFIISFLIIIFIGSFLLTLPKATYNGISYLDALFTSTSAVCVTGLAVVDTGTHFTFIGQSIIMILIQVGGLGILTFASYFSYFFKGKASYENQLILSDMNNSKKLGEIFTTLKYIIVITFGIELFSGILIYSSLDSTHFTTQSEQLFFATFHAISAFCNAGFSTLSNNLNDETFKFNYYLQFIITLTFVLGGLGFPIVVNLIKYLKYKIIHLFSPKISKHKPWILNLNSRITLFTTLSITFVAFIFFYFLEYHNTLADHQGIGKVVTALFGATTPRTAGFNSIDTAAMTLPTLFMVFVLMWIGASPQSTGGGIKTSTFAIAILNILSIAKGKSRIEIFRREIAENSVKRAFAIITLSFVVIGLAILFISIFDPLKSTKDIAFECFSAYGTVGLSLGITSYLSSASKIVIIIVMFIGRISMLSFVIAVFKKVKHKNYHYPIEEITIN